MKKIFFPHILSLLLIPLHCFAQSQGVKLDDQLTASASVRTRFEDRNDFKFNNATAGNDDDFFLTQVRLGLDFKPTQDLTLFIEGQDSALLGEDAIDDSVRPNIYSDDFDLHQGFTQYTFKLFDLPSKVKIGRQKLKYGSERLVGPLEWVNTARVFDAALLQIGDATKKSLDFFSSRMVTVDPSHWNDWSKSNNRYADSDFHGIYYTDKETIEKGVLEGYYLLRNEGDINDSVHTIGNRLVVPINETLSLDSEIAAQFGEFADQDHRAYAAHLGSLYKLTTNTKTGVAYNYATGDDDPNDGDHKTFDNLFPTNHMYYGMMDFFSWQNMHNLEFTISTVPVEPLTIKLGWQNFWLDKPDSDAWYNAGLGSVRPAANTDASSYVGNELDLSAEYAFYDRKLLVEAGYAHFFSGSYVKDTGPQPDADFTYLQVKYNL